MWSEGLEPSSPVWRTGILAVGRRPRGGALSRWTPGRDSHPRLVVCSHAPELLGHRALTCSMSCQGGARTPAFRVTAGRLPARPPGMALLAYRDGDSNPALRVEGPASSPLDHRGVLRKRGDSNAHGPHDPYLFSGQAPHPAGSLPWRKGWDSHPQRAYPRRCSGPVPHLAGSLPWGPRWESHPRPRPYQGRALTPELQGPAVAPRRHDSNVRPPPSDDVALIR